VRNYKLYSLDRNGRVFSVEDCEARDDLSALDAGRARCADNDVEVWQEGRRVGRLKKGNGGLDASDRESL